MVLWQIAAGESMLRNSACEGTDRGAADEIRHHQQTALLETAAFGQLFELFREAFAEVGWVDVIGGDARDDALENGFAGE